MTAPGRDSLEDFVGPVDGGAGKQFRHRVLPRNTAWDLFRALVRQLVQLYHPKAAWQVLMSPDASGFFGDSCIKQGPSLEFDTEIFPENAWNDLGFVSGT